MKKNTLVVSMLIGLGSLVALFAVFSGEKQSQYESRNSNASSNAAEVNKEFFDYMRRNEKTGKFEPEDYEIASQAIRNKGGSRSALGVNWSFVGPDNIGGLTRAIVIDNVDNTRLYAASDGGGVLVSTNSGGTWEYKSDGWVNVNVGSMAQDPDGRLYAGTGIGIYANTPGGGMYASDDRGETWTLLSSTIPSNTTPEWRYINRILTSKTKNTSGTYTVYAGTNRGLWVSVDNGVTWSNPMTLTTNPCVGSLNSQVTDIVINDDGRVFIAYAGSLYISDKGEEYCTYTKITYGIGGSSRMSLAVCPKDGSVVYAYQGKSNQGVNTFEVLKSTDSGESWATMSPAPPTPAVDSTFDLLGYNPVAYNQAITVDPSNCDNIYVGAVEMFRVSGSWTSVATRARIPNFYVHADKHWFIYDPKDPNTMYVGSDGGIGKTTNAADGLVMWSENNRHYATTEYYGVAVGPTGKVIGGSQDNGNHVVDPSLPGVSGVDGAYLWTLGDGFDCDASTLGDIAFVTSQYGNIGRDFLDGSTPAVQIHQGGNPGTGGVSPFNTVIRLWESKDDITSKDSVVFNNDTSRFSVGNGDGNKQVFTGTLRKIQASAKIVPGTVSLEDIAGGQFADDSDQLGILKSFGDSVGVIDYITGAFSVRWNFAPPLGSSVNSVFNVKYNAGDTLNLISANQKYPFNYILTAPLSTNDSVLVQDPIQTLLAVSMNDGINISREALYESATPSWISIPTIAPTAMEYSKDGNNLYLGGYNGTVVRISGLNELYNGVFPDSVLTKTVIFNAGSSVSGLCIHPTDPGKLLVTVGGFGSANHIYELTNAENAINASSAGKRNLQGAMPDFPVYDPEYNVNKPGQVLLGTEFGVWTTDDINASVPTWTQEAGGIGNVRVLDVLQQRLPFDEATNYGKFYLATYGRGLWSSDDLVSVDDDFADFSNREEISNLKFYPNPVSVNGNVSFDMPVNGTAEIVIFDIAGKVVNREVEVYAKGKVNYQFSVINLPAGTYFMSVNVGSAREHAKFVVVK